MAFADLFLGAFSLPIYIYDIGYGFRLWTTFVESLWTNKPLLISYMIVDTAFSQASLISAVFITCERFYAIRWPFKHRTLSTQAYRIAIFSVWALALLISAMWTGSNLLFSNKHTMFFLGPYTLILILITCGCNIGIWKKFVCLVFPCTKTILWYGKPFQLLQLFCQSNFLRIKNCWVSTSTDFMLYRKTCVSSCKHKAF